MGARSGDIVKRVNGHVIDSTPKLMKLWESLKNEPKITMLILTAKPSNPSMRLSALVNPETTKIVKGNANQ